MLGSPTSTAGSGPTYFEQIGVGLLLLSQDFKELSCRFGFSKHSGESGINPFRLQFQADTLLKHFGYC